MLLDLSKEFDRHRFKEYCNKLYKQESIVELKKHLKKRTRRQNSYLHLILQWYAHETGYTSDEVKQEIFKREVCRDFFAYTKNGKTFYRSTRDLDTLEMTNAIERFRNVAQAANSIYLPAPNETVFLQQMEIELKRYGNAQYI